ncbi:tetratricopeptide repeat protein [Massilia glaciei]|uniref:Tetratricopeptide repeat protein n=1 Tax=Massilia glaciei TaxID=1524097 RepID=A0A2U2HJU1_9BURK|nr:tetratricopeptide repeat protein [Massilia glaciei]
MPEDAAAHPARPRPAPPPARRDPRMLRLAALCALGVLVLATFAGIYWRSVHGGGASKHLPMVPMPGQGGVIVAAPAPWPQAAEPVAQLVEPLVDPLPEPSPEPLLEPLVAPAPPVTEAPVSERFGGAARDERAMAPQNLDGPPAEPAASDAPSGPPPASAALPAGAPLAAEPPSAGPDGGAIRIARASTPERVDPALEGAYAQFAAGDLRGARQQYASVLARDPNNRDAMLGLAAIALREGHPDQALALYQRMLSLDANDGDAIAAISALRQLDPNRAESGLRHVLRATPDNAPVLFTLGNLYAQQGRWQEAQQAYFRAFAAMPGNADYAFNLAVGLDRLNQPALALDYYRRALALGRDGQADFDHDTVRRRIAELEG